MRCTAASSACAEHTHTHIHTHKVGGVRKERRGCMSVCVHMLAGRRACAAQLLHLRAHNTHEDSEVCSPRTLGM